MNKLFVIFLFAASQIFTQDISSPKLLSLETEIKNLSEINSNKIELSSLPQSTRKNPGLAIVYSLLLPGMGELYAGSYSSGKYFTIAEGALWGTYIGINSYGIWQRDRYKAFAQSQAGIESAGKDEDYFAIISEYVSIDEYNDAQALNRDFKKMYDTQEFNWDWQTVENRRTYRGMWVSSEQAFNNLRFVVGALILNRIASAVNAVRLVAAYNRQAAEEMSWNVSAGVSDYQTLPPSFTLNFHTSF
jgi:hypothetical protein